MNGCVIDRVWRSLIDFILRHTIAAMDAGEMRIERLRRRKVVEIAGEIQLTAQKTIRAAGVDDQPRPHSNRQPISLA